MRSFPCESCGANVEFVPGTESLVCPYCDATNKIPQSEADIVELDFMSALKGGVSSDTVERVVVSCGACGATVTFDENVTSDRCNFCDAPIVAETKIQRQIKPGSLLPFKVTHGEAEQAFQTWLSSRWFAPSDLTKRAKAGKIDGTYIPFWTYDTQTKTFYSGLRGDYYYVNETVTVRRNGETRQETKRVRKTRWSGASGTVWVTFDDLLVLASDSIPESMTDKLEPWDLQSLVAYDDAYLSGLSAECYKINLENGFERAKRKAGPRIESVICGDIGGDQQQISSMRTSWYDITYKHLLLPVWISAYRYNNKPFQFLVNARTKEVQGNRPYSVVKISLAVLAGLLVAIVLFLLFRDR